MTVSALGADCPKLTIMKLFLSLCILVTIVLGCRSNSRDVKFRAVGLYSYANLTRSYVELVEADSAYKAGDTVYIGISKYILKERVK